MCVITDYLNDLSKICYHKSKFGINKDMKKICVIFGGPSSEHDISVITGMQLSNAIERKYAIEKIYWGLDGEFYLATKIKDVDYFYNKKNIKLQKIGIIDGKMYLKSLFFKKNIKIECVVNCCHGGAGEAGDLASLLSLNGIKYTSANSLASQIAMNKSIAKMLVQDIVPVIDGVRVTKENFKNSLQTIADDFPNELIVKPNSLGSSIGVKACTKDDYIDQINAIFEMGDDALVERRVCDLIEYNQACIKTKDGLITSCIERPISSNEVLTFEDKYQAGSKSNKGRDRVIPADIDAEMTNKITDMTKDIYNALNMNGVVRIDYIFDKANNEIYFNEINTIPGSMAYYLFEPMGIDYIALIDMMIINATAPKEYVYFETDILKDKKI